MDVRGRKDRRHLSRFGALLGAVIAVVALFAGKAPAFAAPPDFIHAEGTRLVDGDGALSR